jgi:chromosome segregation ATPase
MMATTEATRNGPTSSSAACLPPLSSDCSPSLLVRVVLDIVLYVKRCVFNSSKMANVVGNVDQLARAAKSTKKLLKRIQQQREFLISDRMTSTTPSIQWNELEKRHSQLQTRVAELEKRLGEASSELASRDATVTSLRQALDVEKSNAAKQRLEMEVIQ